jgi:hypothetical protein
MITSASEDVCSSSSRNDSRVARSQREFIMFSRSGFLALLLSLAVLTSAIPLVAQTAEPGGAQSSADQRRTVTTPLQVLVRGCLKRGNDGGYYLTDNNGNSWKLSSKTVDLAAHVNHAVELTGKPGAIAKQGTPDQPANQTDANGNPLHPLQVLTLNMLSNSCTR